KPLTLAVADAVGYAVLAHRPFPQREREQFAARLRGDAVALRMDLEAREIFRRVDELARRLRPMRRHVDRKTGRRIVDGIEQPDLGAALIHDAPTVALRVP